MALPKKSELVILDQKPKDLTPQQIQAIETLRWFRPSLEHHPEFQSVILVRYKDLKRAMDAVFNPCELKEVGAYSYIRK